MGSGLCAFRGTLVLGLEMTNFTSTELEKSQAARLPMRPLRGTGFAR